MDPSTWEAESSFLEGNLIYIASSRKRDPVANNNYLQQQQQEKKKTGKFLLNANSARAQCMALQFQLL